MGRGESEANNKSRAVTQPVEIQVKYVGWPSCTESNNPRFTFNKRLYSDRLVKGELSRWGRLCPGIPAEYPLKDLLSSQAVAIVGVEGQVARGTWLCVYTGCHFLPQ